MNVLEVFARKRSEGNKAFDLYGDQMNPSFQEAIIDSIEHNYAQYTYNAALLPIGTGVDELRD